MIDYKAVVENWRKTPIKSVEDVHCKLANFRILFAYNSNVIENPETTYHTTREIFENGKVINFTGDLRTLYEIQNQKYCFDFLAEKIAAKEPITKELILKLHGILMNGCYDEMRYAKGERPGTFKKHEYVTGDDVGELPENVESEIDFICDQVADNEGNDPLKVAAYLHLNFESIHPFADGNGRVGRTLLNYYLMTHDYPPTIIYNEDKEYYYMALTVFDKTEKLDGFIDFLQKQTEKTWDKTISKKKDIARGKESVLDRFYKSLGKENDSQDHEITF